MEESGEGARKVEAEQASGGERWTHDRVIGEYQQYFFKRLLKLDHYLLQELVVNKVITRKVSAHIQKLEDEDALDYFIALIKKKNVSKFIQFLEVLETTFSSNGDHKSLVSSVSEHLLLIQDLGERETEIIKRVIRSAEEIGSEVSTGQTQGRGKGSVVGGQTVIESELKDIKPKHTQFLETTSDSVLIDKPSLSTVSGGGRDTPPPPQQMSGDTGSSKWSVGIKETTERQRVGGAAEYSESVEEKLIVKMREMNMADTTTVSPPRGFIEPKHEEKFSHDNLINDLWTFQSVEHGLFITIPKEAVPSHVDRFSVSMHAYLWGNFDIPDEYEICTAIFVLQVQPKFNFSKPVSLKIPHSVIFDEDDQPEDFIILCAPEPDNFSQSDTQSSTPSHTAPSDIHTTTHPDDQAALDQTTSVQPIYKFSEVISNADYSEDYYFQVNLDHFSGFVGVKRRRRYRQRKGSLPCNRQNSVSKQRRGRRRVMRDRVKRLEKGGSIGSSRNSSCEGSFDSISPATLRQCSSAESDGPFTRKLKRQSAIDLLRQASSTDEDSFNNEIIIYCCGQEQFAANWTTRFMLAPATPTGMQALKHAANRFIEGQCSTYVESVECVAMPSESSHFIGFDPHEWSDANWMIQATTTPQIHLSQIYGTAGKPPHIDFHIRSSCESRSAAPLSVKITATGATVNGREPYFIIKSAEKHVQYRSDVIHTESWLYQDNSPILHALENSSNIDLDPFEPEHCKLLADIASQIPNKIYKDLVVEFGFSKAQCDQIEAAEKRNLPECVYGALSKYVISGIIRKPAKRTSLQDLKLILAKVGISDIHLCHTSIPLLSEYPELYRMPCDQELCLALAKVSPGTQWRFVGRYLGLSRPKIDEKPMLADRESEVEAVIQMFRDWKQQFGPKDANMAALAKAIYRVGKLHLNHMWLAFLKEIQEGY